MEHRESLRQSRQRFSGEVLRLYEDTVELENGKTATREVIRHRGAVCIAAVTEEGGVYLVRQFRYPMGKELWELPAGKLEPGEAPLEAAERELGEEAGVSAQELYSLGDYYPAAAYSDEVIHCYAARGLSPCQMALDEDEFLTPEIFPMEKLVSMVLEGEICDGKTCVAVMRLWAWQQRGAWPQNRRVK